MDKPARLLVVDDSQDTHEMMELIFGVPGDPGPRPVIHHAWDGRQALDLAVLHQDLDAVVLDLVMPGIDGFEVLARLRGDRRFRNLPVLVFTGNRDDATKALKQGAQDFVRKPGDYLEMKLRIQNLVESKRRAEASEQIKIDFLAVVSHELRTPMNGILGMTQALKDEGLSPGQEVYLAALEQSSQRMMALINNVLRFLESENPLHSLPKVPFRLSETVGSTLDALAPEARRNGVAADLQVGAGVPDRLVGLPDKLQLILHHLVSNAIKFSPGGRVTVEVDRKPGTDLVLSFSVRDTGVGFPEDRREKLFEPFTQLDGSQTRSFGGLGIGLAVASRLVQMLGGNLEVDSRPGEGSLFRFCLAFGEEPAGL